MRLQELDSKMEFDIHKKLPKGTHSAWKSEQRYHEATTGSDLLVWPLASWRIWCVFITNLQLRRIWSKDHTIDLGGQIIHVCYDLCRSRMLE